MRHRIYYPSRHDNDRFNVALFKRPHLLEQIEDADLLPANVKRWKRKSRRGLVYGPPVLLKEHPETESTLRELKVATLP